MSIKKASLHYQDEKSDKVYEVEIVYLGWEKYQVNFAYGKTGSKLKTGTKTNIPVSLKEAKKIFDGLVHSKQNKGYKISDSQYFSDGDLLEISLSDRQKIIDSFKQKKSR